MSEILEALVEAGADLVRAGEPMARHTSWRIGGPAEYICQVQDEAQLRRAIGVAKKFDLPWLVLGGGNNILVSDDGIAGLVILNRLRGISIEDDELNCGAGVFFARAALFSARHGYAGMEWGIAIPGTVGGGVVNNAGAHWAEVANALLSVSILQIDGSAETLEPADLQYRYRQSLLKRPYAAQSSLVVTSCRFALTPDTPEAALGRIEELREHRRRTQPIKEASAGSTFKNPNGGHAGLLIDRAGLKGFRLGQAQISPLHANFILNLGQARAADVLSLMELAQNRVREQFGVELEPEVQLVGRWNPARVAQVVTV
ncbi:MAG: UDP-N-acetylmuramate dehydrogenase [Chloroflexota bacterium]